MQRLIDVIFVLTWVVMVGAAVYCHADGASGSAILLLYAALSITWLGRPVRPVRLRHSVRPAVAPKR